MPSTTVYVSLFVAAVAVVAAVGFQMSMNKQQRPKKQKRTRQVQAAAAEQSSAEDTGTTASGVGLATPGEIAGAAQHIAHDIQNEQAGFSTSGRGPFEAMPPTARQMERERAEAKLKQQEAAEEAATKSANSEAMERLTTTSRLGSKFYKAQQNDKAVANWSEAIDLARQLRQTKSLRTLLSNRAAANENLGNITAALLDCTEALRMDRTHVKTYARRARLHQRLNRDREAIYDLTGAVLALANTQLQGGGTEELQQEFIRLQQEAEVLLRRVAQASATALMSSRPPQLWFPSPGALRVYYRSFMQEAEDLPFLAEDATVESISQQLVRAVADEYKAELMFSRALLFRKSLQMQQAHEDLEAIYNMNPRPEMNSAFYNELGTVRHLYGDLPGAQSALQQASELCPTCINTMVKRAGVAFDSGDRERADELFSRALEIDPDAADVYFHRGQMQLVADAAQGPDAAIADLNRCLELAPAFALAHMQLGAGLFRKADMENAMHSFQCAAALAPDLPDVYAFHGEAIMSQEDLNEEKATQVRHLFQKALEVDDSCAAAHCNLGVLTLRLASHDRAVVEAAKKEAEKQYTLAKKVDPQFQTAYLHSGNLKSQTDDFNGAIAEYDTALELCKTEADAVDILMLQLQVTAQQKAATFFRTGEDFSFDPTTEAATSDATATPREEDLD